MNEEERAETIAQMRKEMGQKQQLKNSQQLKEQERVQEKAQKAQMNHMQNMKQVEQTNQHQGADRFQQGKPDIGSQSNKPNFGQR